MASAAAEIGIQSQSDTSAAAVVLDICSSPKAGSGEPSKADASGSNSTPSAAEVKSGGLARLLGCLLGFFTAPCQLFDFLRSLYQQFRGYVPMAVLQYGVNQGIGFNVAGFAMRYYYLNEFTPALDPAVMGRYTTAARLPWNIKPCVGLLSDALPLWGYHRTSYLIIAGASGVLAYAILGTLPLAALATVPLYFLVNVSVSAPDVIIDASTAELSKVAPERASDLQSLSWGALSVGGLMACALKGPLEEIIGAKKILLGLVVCSAGILVPGLLRWLPEQRLPPGQRWKLNTKVFCQHRGVSLLAAYMSVSAVLLSVMQVVVDDKYARGAITVMSGIVLSIGVYATLRHITPILAKTALFIFLRQCLQPGLGEAMFVWLTKAEEGPKFSPTMLGWIDCFGSFSLLLGITIYNKYLTRVSYRKIFLIAQISTVFSNLFDYVLVMRWNRALGIPDALFIIGDDAFTVVMSRFFSMPLFVLAAKVCPDSLEATLFAMLMSLSNFGSTISEFAGVTLCEAFGVDKNFDMLPEAIITKSLCRLLPIPLILMLVPNLTPCDPIETGCEHEGDVATKTIQSQGMSEVPEEENENQEAELEEMEEEDEADSSPLRARRQQQRQQSRGSSGSRGAAAISQSELDTKINI
mmetsp:Transcript_120684/g.303504  ORF Transcript_120684/g.303504 Transcript_120684/m.303504 type:complete len:639 (-) Transcript_120684:232-2148(-)